MDTRAIFQERVRDIVKSIPKGKTMTYKEVAISAGYIGAARAVGSVMKANFDNSVPCHRVVRSDGKVGGYNRGGEITKEKILKKEGAII